MRPSSHPLLLRLAVCGLALVNGTRPAVHAAEERPDAEFPASVDAWLPFEPDLADSPSDSAINLRWLNESSAGVHGFVRVKDGAFVLGDSARSVRFWGVNLPLRDEDPRSELAREARLLAGYGVNLVRVHSPLYDENGNLDHDRLEQARVIAAAMKHEGIYLLYSIYFPLWLKPRPDHPWLRGFDGQQHPFALLMFDEEFQEQYREWWRRLLLTPSKATGTRLVDEPAVLGLELQNEDSFLFWTFDERNIPPTQLARLERRFGEWLVTRHGSIEAALAAWNTSAASSALLASDRPAEGRMSFRKLGAIVSERTARDQDTIAFLVGTQREFYRKHIRFLRDMGFKGLITCSNWTTASATVLGPLEKYTYTAGDFIDRHGYFGSRAFGEGAEWSIRPGHRYRDRSALRFEAPDGGAAPLFVHPVSDPKYDGLPSMLSETTWTRPNRHRSEAPLYYAAFGALQDSNAIVHFAFDGSRWSTKPNFWMQPWTLMSPAMMGQFPAAALMYRLGLIRRGDVLANVYLPVPELLKLSGTPLPQDASLDELRQADARGQSEASGGRSSSIDPLIHFAGRTSVTFEAGTTAENDLSAFVNRNDRTVKSSTGELMLYYANGVLTFNASRAQGISGTLSRAGSVELQDVRITSPLEVGHVIVVSLDGRPIAESKRLLLQAMSEERSTGFETTTDTNGERQIVAIGGDPWQIRAIRGEVAFRAKTDRPWRVTSLDFNGRPRRVATLPGQAVLSLEPATLYYLIER